MKGGGGRQWWTSAWQKPPRDCPDLSPASQPCNDSQSVYPVNRELPEGGLCSSHLIGPFGAWLRAWHTVGAHQICNMHGRVVLPTGPGPAGPLPGKEIIPVFEAQ